MQDAELEALSEDRESDRVERRPSLADRDRIREAVWRSPMTCRVTASRA
jgi:hypothetical protein